MSARFRTLTLQMALVALVCGCTISDEPPTSSADSPPDRSTTSHPSSTVASLSPVARDQVEISGDNTYPEGVVIPEDESWVFDPDDDTSMTLSGNLVVRGELVMRPGSGEVDHVITFADVDESRFRGGGMEPVESDVGLWVVGDGQLDLQGEEKSAWGYEYDPGWEGDEVIAAPNEPGDFSGFREVDSTPPPNELGYPTELLNLTRNVRIEGTTAGKAHLFIQSTRPQSIRYAALRYVAPSPGEFSDSPATGRYGIHFHHSGDGSRGSIVEGVVVRDAGNHAFVPHASHGITMRDTIAFDVAGEAYWWDEPPDSDDISNDTNDVLWERAVAAGVVAVPGGDPHRLTGFFLGRGRNPTVTESVAVGVQNEGGADRSGFHWPEKAEANWTFEDNVAHNNGGHGIFVWQNNELPHVVDGFTAYHNEYAGIEHGAYLNSYEYRDLVLRGNGAAVVSHALGKPEPGGSVDTQIWSEVTTDGGVLVVEKHTLAADAPVRFVGCDLGGVYVADAEGEPSAYDFIDCGLEPDNFALDEAQPRGVFRIQRTDGSAVELRGDGSVREIAPFYGD